MSINVRVIPCLDVDAGRVVKGVNFVGIRDAGDPVELAARYDAEGADELIFLDITATSDQRGTTVEMARRTAEEVFIPFTVGGGVRSVDDARQLLRVGADKVAVNSAAVARPELVDELAAEFGRQCVVVAIDARRRQGPEPTAGQASGQGAGQAPGQGAFEVVTHGGRQSTSLEPVAWAQEVAARGAGEILLNSIDRDGTKDGFDIELTAAVAGSVEVPVIASGGVGNLTHLVEGVRDGGAEAVLAASIFHFGQYSIRQAKQKLLDAGISTRPV